MEGKEGELGPLARSLKRRLPFIDNVGKKDRKGNSINLMLYEGRILSPFGAEYYEFSRKADVRPDDIFVCGFSKSGCHWIWETLSMIQKGEGTYSKMGKMESFLEAVAPELYDTLPSPRILNTHNRFDWLPEKVHTYKNKIILTTRNPKDVAVSLYNHQKTMKEVYNYHGEFPDWFELFLEGYTDNGEYFDYYLSWDKAIRENPDHPVMVLKYEDAIEDFPGAVRRLAEFINTPLTEDQVQVISMAASFNALKKHYEGYPTYELIRKGVVGNWKSWLTEEQSRELERRSEALKGSPFETRYEL